MSQDELKHYGILRKSGRYPWGSGKDEYARSMAFFQLNEGLKAQGVEEKVRAQAMGLSVADLRATTTIAKEQMIIGQTAECVKLRDKNMSPAAIAEQTGIPEATVRLRLKNSENIKKSSLRETADVLRAAVDEHKIVDIGKGVDVELGIASTKLGSALAVLRDEGYETYSLPIRQPGSNGNFTNTKVIVPPGTGFGGAVKMQADIHTLGEWSENEGLTFFGIHEPMSISSKRLKVNFAEDGGEALDGVVYVRPGVKDLSMGKNTYAQVRIKIDDTHFIKGMAVIKDDLPDGLDLLFNTNKKREVGKMGALKELKDDKDNPFGSIIKRQLVTTNPKTGKEELVSAMNIVNETGDWDGWRKSVPSQFLAKQPHSLIKSQLDETRKVTKSRIDEINLITNPVVRKKALQDYADQIDADAVDLRAAQMPRQQTQVIIPVPGLRKQEIYAPNFNTGEQVVLIRYPHGGRFEIPEVVVNNSNRAAKKILGNARDAIGIHPSVAATLSGADFDGDTVVVIPNPQGKIKGAKSMGAQAKIYEDKLRNFEPKRLYGGFVQSGTDAKGRPTGNFKLMTETGLEMGKITNLITDMSIQNAQPEHIIRAVKHSMVVIDAEKHKLNYKKSEEDNGIQQLKTLYQGSPRSGATTLLSQATAGARIPDRKVRPAELGGAIDKVTGERRYVDTGKTRNKYDAKTKTYLEEKVPVTKEAKRLALTDDAFDLVRDAAHPVERQYAEHANAMKAMANATRLQADRIPNPPINPKAKAVYKPEVDKLVEDLRAAQKQKPLDRKAQIVANGIIKAKMQDDPLLRTDADRKKKVEKQAITAARARLNLKKPVIEITDRQWDAIQAGAVSSSRLREILDYADPKRVAELAMPRTNTVMTSAITSRARAMFSAGATTAEVAAALGVSASTLKGAIVRGELDG